MGLWPSLAKGRPVQKERFAAKGWRAKLPAHKSSAMEHDGLPTPRRYWSVLTIWLALTITVLDGSIANVALPTIARELNVTASDSIWVVNAYQIAITVALLPLASLGECIGYRKVYLAGLAVFIGSSLACALSPTLEVLTLSRVVQGFGAAGIFSVNVALVRFTYPSRMLGRGLGLNALVLAVSSATGPTIASAILAIGPWQWLFAVNLPIGLIAFVLGARALPQTPKSGRKPDVISALLNLMTFGPLIHGVDVLTRGGGSLLAIAEIGLSVGAGLLLTFRSLNIPRPMVPIDLLRIPLFALSILTSVSSFIPQALAIVSLPFYLQGNFHRSAVETGLLITPWPLAVGLAGPIGGRLADRYPAGLLGAIGLTIFAMGLASLALLPADASNLNIAWRMALCGLGFGLFTAPNNRAMVSSSPLERTGSAGGLLATARLLGQTTGASIVAMLFYMMGPASGTVMALWIGVGMAGLAATISCLRLGRASARPSPPGPH